MPKIQNARCAAITPPIKMTGSANEWRERRQVRFRISAMAQAALNSDNVTMLANRSSVPNCS